MSDTPPQQPPEPTPGPPPYALQYAQPTAAPPPYAGPVRTDGFAIASLVLGIIGGSVLAIVFGLVALRRIARSNGARSGRGMAIAGTVLGAVWLAVTVAALALLVAGIADRNEAGEVVEGGSVDAMSIAVGDCLMQAVDAGGEPEMVDEVAAVPCDEPHSTQILARYELTGTEFPGEEEIVEGVEDRCSTLVAEALNVASDDYTLGLIYLYPTRETWNLMDDREVLCGVEAESRISETLLRK